MSDIALIWDPVQFAGDVAFTDSDFVTDDGMETAVLQSLFCDRPANPGDVLPNGTIAIGGEGGWWADSVPVVEGDHWGSRLWLLKRSKQTNDVLSRAQDYATEALQWFVDDGVAASVSAVATFFPQGSGYTLAITITRPDGTTATFRFNQTWAAEAARL